MNNRWSSSLLWAIVAFILLLSVLQPIQVLTMSFIAVPFVMLYVTQSKQDFAFVTTAILAVIYLLKDNGMYVLVIALYFIIPAIVVGQLFKRGNPALNVFMAGTITFLVESLVLFIIVKWVLDFNVYEYVMRMLNYIVFLTQVTMEMKKQFALLVSKVVPFIMIISALYMGTVTYAISCRLITIQGHHVQRLQPVRDWMLPKSLVPYSVMMYILSFFGTKSTDSFLTITLLNLMPLLQLAFTLQGIAFLFFYAYIKNLTKIFPVIVVVMILFFPSFAPLLPIVGFLDLTLPLRKFLSKSKV